jgi:CRISPR-associated protein Cas2
VEVLVAYDVSTETPEGRVRLRRVAQLCEAFGQRVQKSVFECALNEAQLEQLIHRLVRTIEPREDSLRIYRLREPRDQYLRVLGRDLDHDFRDPLIV